LVLRSLKPILVSLGLYQVNTIKGRFFDEKQTVATNNFILAIGQATTEREVIAAAWDGSHLLDMRTRMELYAFPSLMSDDVYTQVFEKALGSVHHPQAMAIVIAIAAMIHVVRTMVLNQPQIVLQAKPEQTAIVI